MRRWRTILAATGFLLVFPVTASAHPLGNFTINQFSRITIMADAVLVHHVIDMAEIPTVVEQQRMDANGDGTVGAAEADVYLDELVPIVLDALHLTIEGAPVALRALGEAHLSFQPGEAGLESLRIELDLEGVLPSSSPDEVAGTFTNAAYADRIGWREIIVVGSAERTIVDASVPAQSLSNELRAYPEAGPEDLMDVHEATFRAGPGDGAGTAPPSAPQEDDDDPLANLLTDARAGGGAAVLAILVSLGLGAAHAASPGHGKTLVAAYLIGSRGSIAQALTLSLTVALTHTAGVFVLGGVVLVASELFVPERVVEWLALAAGLIVIALGTHLAMQAWRSTRHATAHHHHDHDHPHHHTDPHKPRRLSTRAVALIGLAGGLVPSASALIVLLVAVSQGELGLGMLLIGAFGIGMALVLGSIGLVVVVARRRLEDTRWGLLAHPMAIRIGQTIPVVAAVAVSVIGLLLTVEAVARIA